MRLLCAHCDAEIYVDLKDDEKSIINADSVPEITYVVTKEELAKNIDEYWQSQSQFGKLFTNPKVPAE